MNQNTSSPVATVETSSPVAAKPAPKAKLTALSHELIGRVIIDVLVPALKDARKGVQAGEGAKPVVHFFNEKQVTRVVNLFPVVEERNEDQKAAVALLESLGNEDPEQRPGFPALVKALQLAMNLAQSQQRPLLEQGVLALSMSFSKNERNEDLARKLGERRADLVWRFIPNLHARITAFRSTITSKRIALAPLPDVTNVHTFSLEDLQKVFQTLSDLYAPVAAQERRQQPAQPQRAPQPPKAKATLKVALGDALSAKHNGG